MLHASSRVLGSLAAKLRHQREYNVVIGLGSLVILRQQSLYYMYSQWSLCIDLRALFRGSMEKSLICLYI